MFNTIITPAKIILKAAEIAFSALQVSFKEEVIEELKFLIKCSNKKIIRRRKSSFETIESNSTGF